MAKDWPKYRDRSAGRADASLYPFTRSGRPLIGGSERSIQAVGRIAPMSGVTSIAFLHQEAQYGPPKYFLALSPPHVRATCGSGGRAMPALAQYERYQPPPVDRSWYRDRQPPKLCRCELGVCARCSQHRGAAEQHLRSNPSCERFLDQQYRYHPRHFDRLLSRKWE